jgi:cytosine permease
MMTVTTLVGLRAINTLSTIIVPILAAVCLLMLWESLKHGSVGSILAHAPLEGLSFGDTVSSVVGGFVVGAVIMPDTCRFIEKPRGAVWTAVLTYFVSSVIVTVIGGLAALATGKVEILDLMLFMGLGGGAFVIVLGGSWILNALNLYSAALSIGVAVPQSRREITTLVAGLAGSLLAFLQILDHFLTFLFYLSIVFVPIASIIIVDFFLFRRAAYTGAALNSIKPVEVAALVAWGAGACIAVLGSAGYLRISGIAAIDAMVAAAVVYGALRWRPRAAASESP